MTLILNGTDNSATTPAVTGTDTDTGVYYPAANQVAIATAGTQAMLANASQGVQFANAIGVGATTPTTSGAGITFPVAQSASTDANTLDDYEEGTFTPSFTSTGISAVTYGTGRNGYYTKVGRLVTVMINIMTDSVTITNSSAAVTITGLPFTSASLTESRSAVSVGTSARFASNPPGAGVVTINTTTVEFYRANAAYTTASDPTQNTAGDFATGAGNNNTMRMIATYMTA